MDWRKVILSVYFGMSGLTVLADGGIAIPDFVASSSKVISSNVELVHNCKSLGKASLYKRCHWEESYSYKSTKLLSVTPAIRQSPQTGIVLDGRFAHTNGQFTIVIDGVSHTIADSSKPQFFPLPQVGEPSVSVTIRSSFSGTGDVRRVYKAHLNSLILAKDNSALVNSVISTTKRLTARIATQLSSYRFEKQLVAYLSLSHRTITELKQVTTGRPGDDLSDDCISNEAGEEDPLDPEQCQKLIHFNRILRNEPSIIDQESLDKSLVAISKSATSLSKALTFLQKAETEASEITEQTLLEARRLLTKANRKQS